MKTDAKIVKITIDKKMYKLINPLDIITTFCLIDSSYPEYDSEKNGGDCWLRRCIELSNKCMRARISGNEKKEILSKKKEIEQSIRNLGISSNSSILEVDNNMLNRLEESIFACFKEISGVKDAKTTKILHKRFPKSIPIVDSFVKKSYKGKLSDIIRSIREDMKSNEKLLTNMQSKLSIRGIKLTKLRIFDILIWIKPQDSENILFQK